MIIGRSVKGLALGILCSVVPGYITEAFEEKQSEKLLSFFQSLIPVGILISSAGAYLGSLSSFAPWKDSIHITWLVLLSPLLLATFTSVFMRESPCDFLNKRDWNKGIELLRLHIENRTESEIEYYCVVKSKRLSGFDDARYENETTLDHEKKEGKSSYWKTVGQCFKSEKVMTAILTQCAVQFSGINAFMYYFSNICSMSNIETTKIPIIAIVLYSVNCISNMIGAYYAGRSSRVNSIFYGFFGMGLCHTLLFLAMQSRKVNVSEEAKSFDTSGVLSIICCFFAVGIFALAISTQSLLYTAEIVPQGLSEVGLPLSFATGSFLSFILTLLLPMFFQLISSYVFSVFGILCILLYVLYLNLEDTLNDEVNVPVEEEVRSMNQRSNHEPSILQVPQQPISINFNSANESTFVNTYLNFTNGTRQTSHIKQKEQKPIMEEKGNIFTVPTSRSTGAEGSVSEVSMKIAQPGEDTLATNADVVSQWNDVGKSIPTRRKPSHISVCDYEVIPI